MNSFEIQDALVRLGFTVVKDNARIVGIGHATRIGEVFYLKTRQRGKGAPFEPMETQPLVIPREFARAESFVRSRAAQSAFNPDFKNSNMTSFSKLDGQFAGLAVDVPDMQALQEILALLGFRSGWTAQEDIAAAADLPTSPTEREQVIAARLGQGLFRERLLQRWTCCAVTGCVNPRLLRASHIKPWRDSTNEERLNIDNGLLLCAGLDAAFDAGLITFRNDGRILASPLLARADAASVGIRDDMKLLSINPEIANFLGFHRHLHGFA